MHILYIFTTCTSHIIIRSCSILHVQMWHIPVYKAYVVNHVYEIYMYMHAYISYYTLSTLQSYAYFVNICYIYILYIHVHVFTYIQSNRLRLSYGRYVANVLITISSINKPGVYCKQVKDLFTTGVYAELEHLKRKRRITCARWYIKIQYGGFYFNLCFCLPVTAPLAEGDQLAN